MKHIKKYLFSNSLTGILLLLFAVVCAKATFIENDFDTATAQEYVYSAHWFEALLVLLTINLIGNIFKYKMYASKDKISQLLIHSSFVVMLIGAGVTRFIGYEGMMHIREGEQSNRLLLHETYLTTVIEKGDSRIEFSEEVTLERKDITDYEFSQEIDGKKFDFTLTDLIPNADEILVEDESGEMQIAIMIRNKSEVKTSFLKANQVVKIGDINISFNTYNEDADFIIRTDSVGLMFKSKQESNRMSMLTQQTEIMDTGRYHVFEKRHLYGAGDMNIVLKNFFPKSVRKIMPADKENNKNAMTFFVAGDGQTGEVNLWDESQFDNKFSSTKIGDYTVSLKYGQGTMQLPFYVKLRDFQLDRYPGSSSPSSFASEVTLIDAEEDVSIDFRIFMNNVLDYRGYRFFQSSYDEEDEKGTVLSINHDRPGTYISYLGYIMLAMGIVVNFFNRKSRMKDLFAKVNKLSAERKAMMMILVMFSLSATIRASNDTIQVDSKYIMNFEHAEKFGRLLTQDQSSKGRYKPINTVASEVMRKVTRSEEMFGLNENQLLLGMMMFPHEYQKLPLIYIRKGKLKAKELKDKLGVTGDYASFMDFFNKTFEYKLKGDVEMANQIDPKFRTKYHKDVIAVDERLNISFMAYTGELLNVLPIEGAENNKWFNRQNIMELKDSTEQTMFLQKFFSAYFQFVDGAVEENDWEDANQLIDALGNYQKRSDAAKDYSDNLIDFELAYNDANIFMKLRKYYALVGFISLIISLVSLLSGKFTSKIITNLGIAAVGVCFILHGAGLGARWYISGHAPWSNGYEVMIYIAWVNVLAGMIFARKSPITAPITAVLASILLWVAGLSWLDPEITSLVPVLKSYWLTIHVSLESGSYGFFALSCLIGMITLLLIIFSSKENRKAQLTIKELRWVNEMVMTIGLFMITIGTFLGGVWANESWGRYWGWDPKETWALISTLIYAFILHMRFIPGLKSVYTFSFMSVIGLGSIMMTYFGVNYYLSGLHSYATGDPIPIPEWVYYAIGIVFLISATAYFKVINQQKDGEEGTI
ncbi:MAG: cytochrome c biogenesis protein CcsA [Flavobacteriales bacterium]|nr:cytochrome c biogenesis protein CcsA [Flavobacteriales bacterium]